MNQPFSGATFLGRPHLTVGGVARNLATALKYLGHQPHFLTALARDNLAELALDQFKATGFSMDNELKVSWFSHTKTDTCNRSGLNESIAPLSSTSSSDSSSCFALVLMDSIKGQCEYVIANLEAIKAISPQTIERNCSNSLNSFQDNNCNSIIIINKRTPLLVMDANLRADTMESIVVNCHREGVPIFLEPTDVLALPRLVNCIKGLRQSTNHSTCVQSILCLSPNLLELQTMIELFQPNDGNKPDLGQMSLEEIENLAYHFMVNCMPELTCLLVTLDKRGVILAIRMSPHDSGYNLNNMRLMNNTLNDEETTTNNVIKTKHFEPLQVVEKPVSASGAGDSFAAGFISGLIDNSKLSDCIEKGFKASLLALNARDTIPASLKSLDNMKTH